jgi:uncharacterized protein (DUF302 family)
MKTTTIAYQAATDRGFEETVEACRRELAKEGFGVLTEIDIKATLAKKLGVDVEPNVILGACHPPTAHRALSIAPEVAVLLPCNVTVAREGGRTVVRAMNPEQTLGLLAMPALEEPAAEVGAALRRVVSAVTG